MPLRVPVKCGSRCKCADKREGLVNAPRSRAIAWSLITFNPETVVRMLPNELYRRVVPEQLIEAERNMEILYSEIPDEFR